LEGKNIKIWGKDPENTFNNNIQLVKYLLETTWDLSEKQMWERWQEK